MCSSDLAAESNVAEPVAHNGFGECCLQNGDAAAVLAEKLHQIRSFLNIRADSVPVNEFNEANDVLAGAFPHIFTYGKIGLTPGQGITQSLRRTLVVQHDHRVAKEATMIFYLFNQLQRHGVSHNVAARSPRRLGRDQRAGEIERL